MFQVPPALPARHSGGDTRQHINREGPSKNLRKRLATVDMGGALIDGGLLGTSSAGAATQGEAVAQSCYGNARDYSKASGTHIYPVRPVCRESGPVPARNPPRRVQAASWPGSA